MIELEFEFEQEKIKIKANLSDLFITVFSKYYSKAKIEPNSVIFLSRAIIISGDKKISDIINEEEKINRKMIITVLRCYYSNKNNKTIVDSKQIICPKCSEHCRIKIEDYIIKLFDCKNNHLIKMSIDGFNQTQKIDLSKITCNVCKSKNMGNSFENNFFICLNCNLNLCVMCKELHNKNHSIINYEQKNYICPRHHDYYYNFCQKCKINLCMFCKQEHLNHPIESFENLISNTDNKRNELNQLKKEVDIFNNNVKKIIKGLSQLIDNLETYYKIFDNIFNNYDIKNKNYQVLLNINQINLNNNIYKEIHDINMSSNNNEKIKNIFKIFYKMKGNNNKDPFNFLNNFILNDNYNEPNSLFLFSDIPSYIKKENKISKDSIYRCNYCPYIPLMRIMYKGYKVYMEYRCQNGHYSYEKLYDFYQRNKLNSINSAICSVGYEINDGKQEFYYCNDCKKYFCERDKKAHEKNDNMPHNLINIKYIDNICNKHFNAINYYCLDCHQNICNKCQDHASHKKTNLSNCIIKDSKIEEYKKKLNNLKDDYNNFYDECDKTIREVLDFIDKFNENLKNFKNVNDYSFNICEDLLNSYQYLKNKNSLNYEVIENINSILNFNDIKFKMDKNFNCLARFIYINSVIKLEYNTLFKMNKNFINFDFQITEEEEKLIKEKNKVINNGLKYRKVMNKNFESTYYGYFRFAPDRTETTFEINGFGIRLTKNYKYIGEFNKGEEEGYGVYYFDNGSFKMRFKKNCNDSMEIYKLYLISGEIDFCYYNKIIDKYQKYGVNQIEFPNGTKKINIIKNNNWDDYGIMYNMNGELYEGYHLSNHRHGFGILKSITEKKNKFGIFYKNELKFGKVEYRDWRIEGEFDMGLRHGYIVEYDDMNRIIYEGQYKNGKKEGFGIKYYDNGNVSYKGYFKNNLEDKFAFMYTSSGKLFYSGYINKGQKKGFGIYYAYDQKGNKIYQYSGNWINDDKCDGYLLKKFPDGNYFFGLTKMFIYQNFMKYKLRNMLYIGETKISSVEREGYGETSYSDGRKEKGIYINDVLV